MWYECTDRNRFLLNLYSSIPYLVGVDIHQLNISYIEDRVTLKFNMPSYADNPPKKWVDAKYNRVIVELDFFCTSDINFKSTGGGYHCDIEISKDSKGLILLDIIGDIEVHLVAEACLVQSVDGYRHE